MPRASASAISSHCCNGPYLASLSAVTKASIASLGSGTRYCWYGKHFVMMTSSEGCFIAFVVSTGIKWWSLGLNWNTASVVEAFDLLQSIVDLCHSDSYRCCRFLAARQTCCRIYQPFLISISIDLAAQIHDQCGLNLEFRFQIVAWLIFYFRI